MPGSGLRRQILRKHVELDGFLHCVSYSSPFFNLPLRVFPPVPVQNEAGVLPFTKRHPVIEYVYFSLCCALDSSVEAVSVQHPVKCRGCEIVVHHFWM